VNLLSLETTIAGVIVGVLLFLAGYYGWQQWRALRGLKKSENLLPEDRVYHRTHARRVFINCSLMVILAGLIGGWYLFGLDGKTRDLGQQAQAEEEDAPPRPLDPEQKRFLTFSTVYWIVAMLVLLVIVYMALLDFWAIRRYGLRHVRQIQADRRAMLERQLGLLRSERNGHHN
jgi:hypothetical protein